MEGVRKMKTLTNILKELILIRKELQAIRNVTESSSRIDVDSAEIAKAVQRAIHGNGATIQ